MISQAYLARNEQINCSARGCVKRRWRSSVYCSRHFKRSIIYGHPAGKPLDPDVIAIYESKVRDLFAKHPGHQAVEAAKGLLNRFIYHGPYATDQTSREMRRLRAKGIKADEALIKLCGVWLLGAMDRKAFPSEKAQTFALSRSILMMAPASHYRTRAGEIRYLIPGARCSYEIGQWVRDTLDPFLSNLAGAIDADSASRAHLMTLIREPFGTAAPLVRPPRSNAPYRINS